MVWHGMAWHGMAWHGMAWYGMVWYGMVWYGMVWYGMVWYGMAWHGMAWHGTAWHGTAWHGMAWRHGMVRHGMARHGMVWYGMVWYGMVWYGMVWYGMVWYGMVWYGMVWYGMVWYGMEGGGGGGGGARTDGAVDPQQARDVPGPHGSVVPSPTCSSYQGPLALKRLQEVLREAPGARKGPQERRHLLRAEPGGQGCRPGPHGSVEGPGAAAELRERPGGHRDVNGVEARGPGDELLLESPEEVRSPVGHGGKCPGDVCQLLRLEVPQLLLRLKVEREDGRGTTGRGSMTREAGQHLVITTVERGGGRQASW